MYKKYLRVISLICLTLFVSLVVFCQDIQIESSNGKFKAFFGLELSNYIYKEPGFMQEKGTKYGFFGEFRLNNFVKKNPFVALQLRYIDGTVDYDGSLTSEVFKMDCIKNYYLEGRFLGGTIFCKDQKIEFYPYFGVGYRYLYDDLGSSLLAEGYERLQRYVYLPVGVNLVHNFVNGLSLSLNVEYDCFLKGLNTSGKNIFGGIGENYNQYGGYGFRFVSKIAYKKSQQPSIYLEPFFRYWDITTSEVIYYFKDDERIYSFEPNNFTQEYGIGLKMELPF
jgi:hypothetical protein